MIDLSKLKITARLLAEEAVRKGYKLTLFWGRPSAGSCTIRCQKNGREFYFKSLNTALTPSYAFTAAEDKVLAKSLLDDANILMPETSVVLSSDKNSPEFKESLKLMKKHKKVVVKPAMTNHGTGVTVGVSDEEGLVQAIRYAIKKSESTEGECSILVQQMVSGDEYRFLVLKDKVIAVATRRPPTVVGDGTSTIEELINEKNKDSRRGEKHSNELTKIDLDNVRDANSEGFLETILPVGKKVGVLKTTNLSRGGEAVDMTDIASAGLKDMAVRAARACGLGIAGIDIITKNIRSDEGFVIEANVTPGIRMHQFPSKGKPRNVAKVLFEAIEKTALPIREKTTIGRNAKVDFGRRAVGVPAKIDTGADGSSVWASNIRIDKNGVLKFSLFGEGSPYYNGKVFKRTNYSVAMVTSASGHKIMKYRTHFTIVIKGRKIKALFGLSDRSKHKFPVLIGCRTLRGKFLVDPSKSEIRAKKNDERRYNTESEKDPVAFYKKYHKPKKKFKTKSETRQKGIKVS